MFCWPITFWRHIMVLLRFRQCLGVARFRTNYTWERVCINCAFFPLNLFTKPKLKQQCFKKQQKVKSKILFHRHQSKDQEKGQNTVCLLRCSSKLKVQVMFSISHSQQSLIRSSCSGKVRNNASVVFCYFSAPAYNHRNAKWFLHQNLHVWSIVISFTPLQNTVLAHSNVITVAAPVIFSTQPLHVCLFSWPLVECSSLTAVLYTKDEQWQLKRRINVFVLYGCLAHQRARHICLQPEMTPVIFSCWERRSLEED